MRALWTVVRVLAVAAAVVVTILTVPFVLSSATGLSIDPLSAVVDVVAIVVIVAALWSLWRDRARLI